MIFFLLGNPSCQQCNDKALSRFMLAFAALVLAVGALMHAFAFNKILSAISASDLASFAANSLKVLWLGDSASCILSRPFSDSSPLTLRQPQNASSSFSRWYPQPRHLIYTFIGGFIGGHIQLVAGIAALMVGLQYPRTI
jgi:hypothetical protein